MGVIGLTKYLTTKILSLQDYCLTKMKTKIGRPKLAKADAKGKILGVRFTPAERKQLEQAAQRADKTLSNWARETLLAHS
jgi:hypothetical protein